jgi:heme-degrading monooxygenase HmoA
MHARASRIRIPSERLDEAARVIESEAIPAVRGLGGFRHGYWLADRAGGRMLVVTLWESEQALRASEQQANQLRSAITQRYGATVEGTDEYEVLAQA